jgi:hypothetical protein
MRIINSSGLGQNSERAAIFISEYYEVLKKPGVTEHVQQLQSVVLQECQQSISTIEIPALQANNLILAAIHKTEATT